MARAEFAANTYACGDNELEAEERAQKEQRGEVGPHNRGPAEDPQPDDREFPCRVLRTGRTARVVTAYLLRVLESGEPEYNGAPTGHCTPS
ncbi:hypothetical protein SLITK23_09920 [Streptomyces lividans]|uniref:Uncharacterized protein n=1 Tax=Streptomyces lividans 1326 TaxID=1200984 RepID=A0A7U9DL73_STRLI|nr:predicted protein [Streptomyces lividans TK24]EOY45991.1 hypothetical protein SLI_1274 [Streptomyces lividans 1326]BDE37747.1 hypothetical protein SLITK23_09920 [Streptomyces lividans]